MGAAVAIDIQARPPNFDCAVLITGLPVIVATLPVPELSVRTVGVAIPSKWKSATVWLGVVVASAAAGLSTAASGALDVLPPVLGMPPVAAAPPVLVMPPVVVVPPVFVVPPVAVVPPAPPAPPLALVSAPVPASTGTFVGASAKAKSTPESCAVPTLASGPMTAPPVFTVPPLPDQAAEVARNCTSCTNANRTVVQIVQNPRRAGRPQVAPTLTPASGRLAPQLPRPPKPTVGSYCEKTASTQ
jgi:hypothetical protein